MNSPIDDSNDPQAELRSRARQRRSQRRIIPHGKNSRVQFFDQLTHQATPSLPDFTLILVAAIIAGIALIIDSPAILVLSVLVAPFLASMVGLALGTLVGSWRFFLQSLIGILVSILLFFGFGALAGGITKSTDPAQFVMAHHLAYVSVADLILLSFGAVMTVYRLSRNPEQKPHLLSAALAYEILLPAAVAGFGFASGISGLGNSALITLLVHLSWAILLGAFTLAVVGLRPNGWLGYALTGAVVLLSLVGALIINGSFQLPQMPHLEAAVIPTVRPTSDEPAVTPTERMGEMTEDEIELLEATETPTATASPMLPTATRKLATATATQEPTATDLPEPTPEPRLAIINAKEGNGAIFRTGPYLSATTVSEPYSTLLNGIYVKLYETVTNEDGEWGHIRLVSDDSIEGWVLRSLLSVEE